MSTFDALADLTAVQQWILRDCMAKGMTVAATIREVLAAGGTKEETK